MRHSLHLKSDCGLSRSAVNYSKWTVSGLDTNKIQIELQHGGYAVDKGISIAKQQTERLLFSNLSDTKTSNLKWALPQACI